MSTTFPTNIALMSAGELYGGVEEFLYTYANYLKQKTKVKPVVVLFSGGRLHEKLKGAKIETEIVKMGFKYDPFAIYRIALFLKSRNIELVHTHGYKASIVGSLAARIGNIKVVKTEHGAPEPASGMDAFKMSVNNFIDRWITTNYIDKVVCITKDLMDSAKVSFYRPKTSVIHNGIPTPVNSWANTKHYFPEGKFNIGIVGRICPVKGHDVLLEALGKVSFLNSIRVHVLGDGPSFAEVKARVEKRKLGEFVTFHGFKNNIHDFMAQLDCLIMPSFHEGLPYTLLEAMHLKIPIIASNVGGMKEILTNDQTALLFEAGNSTELAARIDAVFVDPALRNQLTTKAYKTALESFTIGKMSEKYLGLYQTLMNPALGRRHDAVFISWDNHRRTRTLADAMRLDMKIIKRGRKSFLNPWWPLLKTFAHLLFHQNRVVIVQNPSLFLTTAACLMRPLKRFRLIQDLHSYFYWHLENPKTLRDKVYAVLSKFCIRHCDLTIVTNEHLRGAIQKYGGRGFVLQDKIPQLNPKGFRQLQGAFNVVFICTYSADEPLDVVAGAARMLDPDVCIYVTGRLPKNAKTFAGPTNLVRTGYLSEDDYANLLDSADAVLALTTRDHTLLCGAYEAISLAKPLIMSDKQALRDYFRKGVLYIRNDSASIAQAIRTMREQHAELKSEIEELGKDLRRSWQERFSKLEIAIDRL